MVTNTYRERSSINLRQIPYLLTTALTVFNWPYNAIPRDGATFDFIIVGAGSAGAVLANRLSESGNATVALIDFGPDPPFTSIVPGLLLSLPGSRFDYNFYGIRDGNISSAVDSGRIHFTQGKMLGGSSSINYMLYVRGNKADYDGWASLGHEGWDYKNVLPYFKKSEGLKDEELLKDPEYAPYHNGEGPVGVSQAKEESLQKKRIEKFFKALNEIGIPTLRDYNGPQQLGVGKAFFTQNHVRSSSAYSFLRNVNGRRNLNVFKKTEVKKVSISDGRAHGVEVVHNGQRVKLFAEKEVIVSAGAFNTPKVLISSGVGPREDLAALNVSLVQDLPVGLNLIDHMYVPLILLGSRNVESRFPVIDLSTVPSPFSLIFARPDDEGKPTVYFQTMYMDEASPLVYPACRLTMHYRKDVCAAWTKLNSNREIIIAFLVLLHPKSTGKVKITSLDKDPEIHPRFLSEPEDLDKIIEGINLIGKLNGTNFFNDTGVELFGDADLAECRHLQFATEDYWRCYVIATANSLWHPVATCAMGKVVDNHLKVKGIRGMRVVDASVLPTLTSGNTNAPTMMVAERASHLIKKDHGML